MPKRYTYKGTKEGRPLSLKKPKKEKKPRKTLPYPRKSKEYIKNLRLKCVFGIDLRHYNQMFVDQEGCCAICGVPRSECRRDFDIDHCHKTGKIRGLLCGRCNLAIGQFSDSKDLLLKAVAYLNKY